MSRALGMAQDQRIKAQFRLEKARKKVLAALNEYDQALYQDRLAQWHLVQVQAVSDQIPPPAVLPASSRLWDTQWRMQHLAQ